MKKALQILEDNFRLSSDDYSKLLGMLQELQQCRDNNASKIIISQEDMEYIQRLEEAAQAVVRQKEKKYTPIDQILELEAVLKEGYE
jgi:hypothetical protein